MLIHERDDKSLLLLQATPRRWLEDGKRIVVERAPTYYGPLTMGIASHAASGAIHASIEFSAHRRPGVLLVRLRHLHARPIKSVSVNGQPWLNFDARRESVRIERPNMDKYEIVGRF